MLIKNNPQDIYIFNINTVRHLKRLEYKIQSYHSISIIDKVIKNNKKNIPLQMNLEIRHKSRSMRKSIKFNNQVRLCFYLRMQNEFKISSSKL